MDKFYIISNIDRDPLQEKSREIADYLIRHGKSCGICSLGRLTSECGDANKVLESVPEDTECALVLGGDGTIIQVAGELSKKHIPLIGINLGRLGFLAEIDQNMVEDALNKLMADEYYTEERMMLEGIAVQDGVETSKSLALNDIVLARFGAMCIVDYDVFVNGKLLTTINGDGVIISSPTGSTGYSMSAGGPIVEPGANVILITPISAHKLNSRPIVLAPTDEVTIKVGSNSYDNKPIVNATFDGGITHVMDKNDAVMVCKAKESMSLIKIRKESFLNVLSRKLSS